MVLSADLLLQKFYLPIRKDFGMTEFNRKAGVLWTGDLKNGNGLISTESKVLYELPYSFQTRFGDEMGLNPEELIAAAHASCFSMALADTLEKNGVVHP
jgi:osmotically inducible protein OsmC